MHQPEAAPNRFVLKFPDGNYSYAYKSDSREAWVELRPNERRGRAQNDNGLDAYQIMQIDNEIEFLLSNIEYIVEPDLAIEEYLDQRLVLFVILMMNVFCEVVIGIYLFKNADVLAVYINQISITKYYTQHQLETILNVSTFVNICLSVVTYFFGFRAIVTHKATTYQVFNVLLLLSVMVRVLLAYFDMTNIVMLMVQIFTYVYSRYCLMLLFRVLILPNQN